MAKSRKTRQSGTSLGTETIRGIFEVLATAIDRFGWPGAAILVGYIFVERHGSEAQKQEFIDLLLHPDGKGVRATIVLGIIAALVFWAQHRYWKQRDQAKDLEIKRLADWKTQHQQAKIPSRLHHTKDDAAGTSPAIPRQRKRR